MPAEALTHVWIAVRNAEGEHLAFEWLGPVTDEVYGGGGGR